MKRTHVFSGTPWEDVMGYCRAVKTGPFIRVSGTTASDETGAVMGDDYASQTAYILKKIGRALEELGASYADVVRTRIFVLDASQWEQVAAEHGKVFGDVRPACTLVEVKALIGDEYLIEIEADAIVLDDD